jgi:hypothetical protein
MGLNVTFLGQNGIISDQEIVGSELPKKLAVRP